MRLILNVPTAAQKQSHESRPRHWAMGAGTSLHMRCRYLLPLSPYFFMVVRHGAVDGR
jgi:hypothetical protein